MCIFVTGGYGFIGSNFINEFNKYSDETIVNIDKRTYASNNKVIQFENTHSYEYDINDWVHINSLLKKYKPRAIIHFAAESHVDNSISNPKVFFRTNVDGTLCLLDCIKLTDPTIKFIHVSTDEVYGALTLEEDAFTENSPYKPNSPYAASKAASDHIVRAYNKTYGLDTITTNCSNNYGYHQYGEKFIPTIINSCLKKIPIPIYGDGKQIRDWLFVTDHCSALRLILEKGKSGESYNIGGDNQYTNIEVVKMICDLMDEFISTSQSHHTLISFIKDRPGHDFRYDINSSKIKNELGWKQEIDFKSGLKETVKWYIDGYFNL